MQNSIHKNYPRNGKNVKIDRNNQTWGLFSGSWNY